MAPLLHNQHKGVLLVSHCSYSRIMCSLLMAERYNRMVSKIIKQTRSLKVLESQYLSCILAHNFPHQFKPMEYLLKVEYLSLLT